VQHVPSFCKKYANLGSTIHTALTQYRDEVKAGAFPSEEHSPYKMSAVEMEAFKNMLISDESARQLENEDVDKTIRAQDEYEAVKLY
jgi:hypothetical protein